MDWILQGNPTRFYMDEYLATCPYVYWRTPIHREDFEIGDLVFIWRSTIDSGVVALGSIAELPTEGHNVLYPEALGNDLWITQGDRPIDIFVGVHIDEIRLTIEEGMITRLYLKDHPVFSESRIINIRRGSVFLLTANEVHVLLSAWSGLSEPNANETTTAVAGVRLGSDHCERLTIKDLC